MWNIIQKSLDLIKESEVFIRKDYVNKIASYIQSWNILVITWQRRVGKSYLIIGFLQYYNISLNQVFYLNKELDIEDKIQNYKDLNDIFQKEIKKRAIKYVIIDEIQNITWWEKFISWIYAEKKYKIIITGSNSKLLSWELATLLTGRYLILTVFPFSYKEFLSFTKKRKNKKSFIEYITFWWLPEVLKLHDPQVKNNYLKTTLESILYRDIIWRYKIKNIRLLEKILHYLQKEVGSLISIPNISGYLKQIYKKEISPTTISNYLKYLTVPYLVNEVERFDIKWKKLLLQISKYYFTDIWLRNTVWFNIKEDINKILENLVYIKLVSQGYNVFVGQLGDLEIDFVAEKNWEYKYIQVCYLLSSDKVIEREFWNLLKIKDNREKLVISMDEQFWWTWKGIKHMNILEFLVN